MADGDSDLMAEFQEFLTAKKERESAEAADEDYEVEVWNEKGQGARLRRSHAKPFLQSLGIDVDAPSGDAGDPPATDGGNAPKSGRQSKPPVNSTSNSVRKYFTPKK
jgi:hypothetical protein